MSQKFPFVFKASQFLPAAPRDMDATWFFSQPRSEMASLTPSIIYLVSPHLHRVAGAGLVKKPRCLALN
jgi:hypothetical protein